VICTDFGVLFYCQFYMMNCIVHSCHAVPFVALQHNMQPHLYSMFIAVKVTVYTHTQPFNGFCPGQPG